MEPSTWLGLLIGFGGILIGHFLEGGHTSSLMQFTAAVIVLAGTLGAVMVSHSFENIRLALFLAKNTFIKSKSNELIQTVHREIVESTRIFKKDSLVALESRVSRVGDPFLKKVLATVVDGIDPVIIRDIFETEIQAEEERKLAAAKVWSDAGGYSPTIGIIGAVLGLIHVMGNLTDTSKLGSGIAVAFVATVYGVSFANLLYLPIAAKIKRQIQQESQSKQMALDGALLITSGLSSTVVDQKMRSFHETQV